METILDGYITCALWTSFAINEEGEETRFDEGQEVSEELQEQFKTDLESFLDICKQDCPEELEEYLEEEGAARFGHDFWLTRNSHGAGFWDRKLDGFKQLTKWAHTFGEQNLYIGDDGRIYAYN